VKYIAVMTDLPGLNGLMGDLERLNVTLASVSPANASRRRNAGKKDMSADRTAQPLPEKVRVGLVAGDGAVNEAMRAILKAGQGNRATVMELMDGLFGGRLKAGIGERTASTRGAATAPADRE